MPKFDVAHLRQSGQDMIIVPLDSSFGSKSAQAQNDAMSELNMRANSAGLRGSVVAVWDAGGGRMAFRAPPPWHPYFRSINLRFVYGNLNRQIYW